MSLCFSEPAGNLCIMDADRGRRRMMRAEKCDEHRRAAFLQDMTAVAYFAI
jgi:hypothetical protein